MRLSTLTPRNDLDELFGRVFGAGDHLWPTGGYNVPTDVFHTDGRLVIRMDLPDVNPDDVEVTMQENTLLINGSRRFPYDAESVRWIRRGTFYGDFTQRVMLGKGLDTDKISARYQNGVLELSIPYSEEVQPRKISIDTGTADKALSQ
ncbi:MAG TPA: Hsp20/alpha crystallin family protein [Actinomycetota bacterium]|nr:Hsp20/alpha crystallin family protein [Actinomycetota bacterium]